MKNMKYMVVALVAAIALLGVGYAQWSDSVAMVDTVSTGKMDVQITGLSTTNPMAYNKYLTTEVAYDANTAYVNIKDLYPGAMGRVDLKIQNKGTMPVQLKGVKVDYVSGDWALFQKLVGRVSATFHNDGAIAAVQTGHTTVLGGITEQPIASDAFANAFTTKLYKNEYTLKPGGELGFYGEADDEDCIQIQLPADAGNEFQQKSVQFKITFNFEQTLPPEHSGQPVPTWWY